MKYIYSEKFRFASFLTLIATLICAVVAGAVISATNFFGNGASADTGDSASGTETLETKWNNAVSQSSLAEPKTFDLTEDWIAQPDNNFVTSFGLGAGFESGRLYVPEGANVILNLNGHTIDRGLKDKEAVADGSVICVRSGKLTITDTSTGGTITGGNNANTVIKNFDFGGGVLVEGRGSLILKGGTISGNKANNGAGVCVSNASFEMTGGTITQNEAIDRIGDGSGGNGGGVAYMAAFVSDLQTALSNSLTISGGTVSANTASGNGGGMYIASSLEFNQNAKFPSIGTVTGGEINGNTAGGNGGGIFVKGCPEIKAGVNISGSADSGITVSGNSAQNGGGVYAYDNSELSVAFTTIDNNTASENYGGLYADCFYELNLSSVSVSNNKAAKAGGGLHIKSNGHNVTAADCRVTGNTAGTSYGGMFIDYSTCTFGMEGLMVINGNTANKKRDNFYLQRDKIINITGALEEGTSVHVSVENEIPYTFTTGFKANANGKNPMDLFSSDIDKGIIFDGDEAQITTLTVLHVKPTLVSDSLVYTGSSQTVTVNNFVEAGMNSSGLTGKDVREGDERYTVVITLKDDYIWYDSTRDPVRLDWHIVRAEIPSSGTPQLTGDVLQTGNIIIYSVYEQDLKISPLSHVDILSDKTDARLTVSSDGTVRIPAKSPVGQYVITVKPSYGYKWADAKAEEELQLTFSIVEYDLVQNWMSVIEASLITGEEKRFVLTKDWIAQANDDYKTSFIPASGGTTPNDKNTGFSYGRLCVPRGAKIILDLDGWTISRNLETSVSRGQVFYVEGQLTVIDSQGKLSVSDSGIAAKTGKITGGANNNFDNGGGVYVDNFGTFIFNGGLIIGNKADIWGGGVYVNNGGTFTMTAGARIEGNTAGVNGGGVYMTHVSSRTDLSGGEITGNTAGVNGGGVFIDKGTFSMGGKVTVLENTVNEAPDNIYLNTGTYITVTAPLTGTRAGVFAYDKPCIFTRNYSQFNAENPLNFFEPNYVNTIALRGEEAYISGRVVIEKPTLTSGTSFFYKLNTAQGLTFDGFDAETMKYDGTVSAIDASGEGGYTALIAIIDTERYMWSDGTDAPMEVKWNIAKINYNMTGVRWDYNKLAPFTYDGNYKEVKLLTANLPAGVSIKGYTLNRAQNAGEYTATVEFEYTDHKNHNAPQVADCVWEIKQAKPEIAIPNPIEGKYFEGGKLSSVPISGESSVEGVFTWTDESETIGDATKEYNWTFTPDNVNYETVTGTIQFTEDNIIPLWKVIVIPLAVVVGIILLILIIVAIRRKSAARADYVFVSDGDDGFGDLGDFDDTSNEDYGSF